MKHTWLFCGLIFLFACWLTNIWGVILLLIAAFFYYRRHYTVHVLFFCFLALVFVSLYPKTPSIPVRKQVMVREIKGKYIIGNTGEQNVIIYGVQDANYGDILYIKGDYQKVDTIYNIGMFHFQTWLHRRNIDYQINAKHVTIKKKGTFLRHALYEHIAHGKNQKANAWVKAMLYGIHSEDVSYFITSSGMHISFLMLFLERQLKRFLSDTNAAMLVLLLLGIVGAVTVFSATLLRVLVFRGVRFLFPTYTTQDKLGISMCILLGMHAWMAFELAFLLPVAFHLIQLFQITKRKRYVITGLVLIPLQFQYFHSCNLVQLALFRYLRKIYAFLYLLAWVYLLFPIDLLFVITDYVCTWLSYCESFGFEMYYTPSLLWLLGWVYMTMQYISYANARLLPLCALLVYAPFASWFDPFGEILMIDVGQGDCTLIRLPFHQGTMLIDVMGSLRKNIPADIIVPVLHAKGITSIDKVVITHADYDHSGGLKELQELMEVKEVIRTKKEATKLGPLHIPFVLANYQGSDENENSIVTYMDLYGLRVLYMGDAGAECEQRIMEQYPNLRVDVLKAGHHGSKTSSSLAFLHQLTPQLALMSAGRGNRYGHPNKETIQRMQQEDVLPLATVYNGAVSIKFCKYFSFFKTADNEFGIIKRR